MAEESELELSGGDGEAEQPKKKVNMLVLIIIAAVIILASVGVTVWLLLGDSKEEENSEAVPPDDEVITEGEGAVASQTTAKTGSGKAPAIYQRLSPPFIVNFDAGGRQHFLQVYVSVMGRDQASLDAVADHTPLIRHQLLLLFSSQSIETLQTHDGKENLRVEARDLINRILTEELGVQGIEQVLFTNFVMQ